VLPEVAKDLSCFQADLLSDPSLNHR